MSSKYCNIALPGRGLSILADMNHNEMSPMLDMCADVKGKRHGLQLPYSCSGMCLRAIMLPQPFMVIKACLLLPSLGAWLAQCQGWP